MKQAALHSCVSCGRGRTPTAVVFEGEADWIILGIARVAGLPVYEATTRFAALVDEERAGRSWGVPAGRLTIPVPLCVVCAARNGVPEGLVVDQSDADAGRPVPAYSQPGRTLSSNP